MKRVYLGILLTVLSIFLTACAEKPEEAAKEWADAMVNLDGNKMLERTCAAQREAVQMAGSWNSALVMLPQLFGLDVKTQADVSDLKFTATNVKEDTAHVQVTGEIRVAVLAVAQTYPIDETWLMVKEDDKWKWCGQASVPSSPVYHVQVFANRGWQDTGIAIRRGQQVTIEYLSGLWFEDPPGHWRDASGGPNPWTCSTLQCHEPLRDFPKYALIGRLGNSLTGWESIRFCRRSQREARISTKL